MIIVALGAATAIAYGTSDFLGGLASRRVGDPLAVLTLLESVAIAVFIAAVILAGAPPEAAALLWAAGAGVAGGFAYIAYFRALIVARMGIVTTITAVWAAIVPVAVGVAIGERPSAAAWLGIVVILVAIVLITYSRKPAAGAVRANRLAEGVLDATLAGVGFGTYFVGLDRAASVTGGTELEWPLLAATTVSAAVVGSVAVISKADWRAAGRQIRMFVPAGLLYAGGSWAFIVAVAEGWISIVAAVAALSPAPTMVLARVFLGELLSARQMAGVALALAGVLTVSLALPE